MKMEASHTVFSSSQHSHTVFTASIHTVFTASMKEKEASQRAPRVNPASIQGNGGFTARAFTPPIGGSVFTAPLKRKRSVGKSFVLGKSVGGNPGSTG